MWFIAMGSRSCAGLFGGSAFFLVLHAMLFYQAVGWFRFHAKPIAGEILFCMRFFRQKVQNGGMASGLAIQMGKVATVGLAPAIFGPWMNMSGASLASWWAGRPPKDGSRTVGSQGSQGSQNKE